MMLKKYITSMVFLLLISLVSLPSFAHTEVHTEHYHSAAGIEYFFMVFLAGLLAGTGAYYFYKK